MVSGTLIYVCLFMALAVVAVVLTITQFYNTVLGPEGYLTNTLPVSVDTIICSKLISTTIWLILSGVVGVLSIMILGFGGFATIGEFFSAFGELFGAIGQLLITPSYYGDLAQIVAALVLMFVMLLFFLFNELLHIYLAMACSQLYPFSKNRIAGSFIAYFLISIPLSIGNHPKPDDRAAHLCRHDAGLRCRHCGAGAAQRRALLPHPLHPQKQVKPRIDSSIRKAPDRRLVVGRFSPF